jgi:polysaccharide export outer membrane protein
VKPIKEKEINNMKIKYIIAIIIISIAMNGYADNPDKKKMRTVSAEASYVIDSGDILKIVTWKEPDFSLEAILVRIDGKISFPLLNDVQAAGLTPLMLKDIIETGLKNYVANPVVTVTVKEPESKKFYILGEVQRTGEYNLVKDISVMQAFALAGGFTEWASKDEILLIRRENGQKKVYKIDYKDMAKGKNLEQDLLIRANDTIIIP